MLFARAILAATLALCCLLAGPVADSWAAITVKGSYAADNAGGSTSLTFTTAAFAPGDVVVVTVAARGNGAITTPGGSIVQDTVNGTTMRQQTVVYVAVGGEPTTFSFNLGTSRKAAGGLVIYDGVDTATPVDASAVASGASGTPATPSVTTDFTNAYVHRAAAFAGTPTITWAAGQTERWEDRSTGGTANSNVTSGGANALQAAAGASGTKTATPSPTTYPWLAHTVALNEEPQLTASFPGSYTFPALNVGAGGNLSSQQSSSVTSNRPWGVRISSDQPAGKMRQWNGTAYTGTEILANPLEWRLSSLGGVAQATAFSPLSSTAASVTTNRPASASAVTVGTTYRQVVTYADEAGLPVGQSYRIAVVYDTAQGF